MYFALKNTNKTEEFINQIQATCNKLKISKYDALTYITINDERVNAIVYHKFTYNLDYVFVLCIYDLKTRKDIVNIDLNEVDTIYEL